MKRFFLFLFLAVAASAGAATPQQGAAAITDEQTRFFESKIRPVLVDKCYSCHSADAKKLKGGLRLDTAAAAREGGETGPAVVPGHPDESLLIEAIRYQTQNLEMPPKEKLPDSVIKDFETWIKMGAPDPRGGNPAASPTSAKTEWKPAKEIDIEEGKKFWAFQLPVKHSPPQDPTGWARTDIDRFVASQLAENQLTPVADAAKLDLIRRITFDLTGLPPSFDDLRAFMQDESPDGLEKVVDRLLQSSAYGEHWGRHWLDVARYGESSGKDVNLPYPFAWRYRDWVIEALNRDLPYNEFVRQQIAGDLLPDKGPTDQSRKIAATAFLAIGPKSHNEFNARQFAMDVVDEQIDAMSQAFLGITVACARCHDHKFDPIPQKDYYALAGIFLSSETLYGTSTRVQNRYPSDLIDLGTDSGLMAGFPAIGMAELEKMQKDLGAKDASLTAAFRTARQDRQAGKEVDGFRLVLQRQERSDMQATLDRYNASGQPRILSMGVYDRESPVNSPFYNRGEVSQPGDEVARGLVQVLLQEPAPAITKGSGRLELANWLASDRNPQTARVFVNRAWRWLFGRGLVSTPDNFGQMGSRPSHPELLDHLAVTFMEQGWSVKKLVRSIVLSRTYQLATQYEAANDAKDPDNIYLWRMASRRLDAESIRDSLLYVAGGLNLDPPVGSSVCQAGEGNGAIARMMQAGKAFQNTRSVYLPMVREQLPSFLALFDAADASLVTGDRDNTNVPSQSLYLLNDSAIHEVADAFSRRVYNSAKDNTTRIVNAYWMAFGRNPTPSEGQAIREFFERYTKEARRTKSERGNSLEVYGWSAFCQALLATAEFRYLN